MKRLLAFLALLLAGCGGKPASIAPSPGGPTAEQKAELAELAKERQAIADERAALKKDRAEFRAEWDAADKKAVERADEIRAATKEYEAATNRRAEMIKAEEAAFAVSEANRKYKEDLVRYAALDATEKMRFGLAANAFRMGGGTVQQKEFLLQFHEFRDSVISSMAKSGEASGFFSKPRDLK